LNIINPDLTDYQDSRFEPFSDQAKNARVPHPMFQKSAKPLRLTDWRVATGLEAVAFAEPRQYGLFRDRGITEPAWLLVHVSPLRTRRAVFPHRAPQAAFTTRCDYIAARRLSAYGSSDHEQLWR
jgi:hypothetical protein